MKCTFDHLSQQHLEQLQRAREELEHTLNRQHQIERSNIKPTLKNYWLVSSKEKHILRYEAGTQHWRGESIY